MPKPPSKAARPAKPAAVKPATAKAKPAPAAKTTPAAKPKAVAAKAKPLADKPRPAVEKAKAPVAKAKAVAEKVKPAAVKPAAAPAKAKVVADKPKIVVEAKPAGKPAPAKVAPVPASAPAKSARPVPPAPAPRQTARAAAKSASRTRDEAPMAPPAACPFTPAEIKEWREILIKARAQYSDDIQGLQHDAMDSEGGHTTPIHSAERGSDADAQDVALNIAGDEKLTLWLIDRALRKIDEGKPIPFGLCEHTRQAISRNRLQLMPWTPLSIEGAQYCEDAGMAPDDVLIDD